MPTLKVQNIVYRHDDLFELQLERGDLPFEPGACMALFNDDGDSRPYSISAGTKEHLLRFLIRRVPNGRVSHWLSRRNPGDKVHTSAPFGWFRPGHSTSGGERCVFIATGTGLFEQVPLADDIHYYLCGLDTMIDETSQWLEAGGIDYTHIHREIFFYEDEQH